MDGNMNGKISTVRTDKIKHAITAHAVVRALSLKNSLACSKIT